MNLLLNIKKLIVFWYLNINVIKTTKETFIWLGKISEISKKKFKPLFILLSNGTISLLILLLQYNTNIIYLDFFHHVNELTKMQTQSNDAQCQTDKNFKLLLFKYKIVNNNFLRGTSN